VFFVKLSVTAASSQTEINGEHDTDKDNSVWYHVSQFDITNHPHEFSIVSNNETYNRP